jgi:hypothetical protein
MHGQTGGFGGRLCVRGRRGKGRREEKRRRKREKGVWVGRWAVLDWYYRKARKADFGVNFYTFSHSFIYLKFSNSI